MKTKLEVFYAQKLTREPRDTCAVMVRYSDACAAISDLESKCEGWRQEALKYEDRARKAEADIALKEALLTNGAQRFAELTKELERMALISQPPYVVEHHGAGGRWDGKCKAL